MRWMPWKPVLGKLGLLALLIGALTWAYGYLTGNHIFSGEQSFDGEVFSNVSLGEIAGMNLGLLVTDESS